MPRHVAIVMDGNGRWAKQALHAARSSATSRASTRWCARCSACADRGIEYLTVFAFSSENWKRPDRRGLRPDEPGAGGGVEVPRQAGRRRRAHPHRRRPQRGVRQAARRPGTRPSAPPRTTRASRCRWPSTTAAAGTSCRPAARPCAAGVAPDAARRGHARPLHGAAATRPTPTCSSAPAARCASATSCSGRRPTRSCSSPIACGPTSARPSSTPRWPPTRARDRRFGGVRRLPTAPVAAADGRLTHAQAARHHRPRAAGAAAAGAVRRHALAVRAADAGADRRGRLGVGRA